MITEKEIRTILHKFATELAEYIYHCNYKFSSSKSFEKGKDLIYKKYTKTLIDKYDDGRAEWEKQETNNGLGFRLNTPKIKRELKKLEQLRKDKKYQKRN